MLLRDWLNRLAWARRRQTLPGKITRLAALETGLGRPPVLDARQQAAADDCLARLEAGYPSLRHWPADLPAMIRLESLAALSLIDAGLPEGIGGRRWLDVGSKNGAAAFGIATAARMRSREMPSLDLVELDAGRRYRGGLRRADHGATLASATAAWLGDGNAVRYMAADVRALQTRHDVITWFLPFLFAESHQSWGLPLSLLAPQAVLRHVLDLLEPGGWLLVVNHTSAEAEVQRQLLAGCNDIEIVRQVNGHDPWCQPGRDRPITVVRRHDAADQSSRVSTSSSSISNTRSEFGVISGPT